MYINGFFKLGYIKIVANGSETESFKTKLTLWPEGYINAPSFRLLRLRFFRGWRIIVLHWHRMKRLRRTLAHYQSVNNWLNEKNSEPLGSHKHLWAASSSFCCCLLSVTFHKWTSCLTSRRSFLPLLFPETRRIFFFPPNTSGKKTSCLIKLPASCCDHIIPRF